MLPRTINHTALLAVSFLLSPLLARSGAAAEAPSKVANKAVLTLEGSRDCVYSVAFDLDGGRVAAASKEGMVKVWDARTGKDVVICKGHGGAALRLAFSPDGKTLATAGADKTVRLWNPVTGAELRKFQGHQNWVAGVAFSPDGKTLASGSGDGTIRLWAIPAGSQIGSALTSTGPVSDIAFSPHGMLLASIGVNQTIIVVWDLEVASWRGQACTIAGRNLTPSEWKLYLPGEPFRKTCQSISLAELRVPGHA